MATVLYLSSSGNSFKITPNGKFVNPVLKESATCKTHEEALQFLEKLKKDTKTFDKVELYHHHFPRYQNHSLTMVFDIQKGDAHKDSIDEMIQFVKMRIEEKSTPHAIFNRIGKTLGPLLHSLTKYAAIPIIGIPPAIIKIGIGSVQVITGLSISILLYLPSLASKNTKIIVQRSWRHVNCGFNIVLVGIFQMIPFHFVLID